MAKLQEKSAPNGGGHVRQAPLTVSPTIEFPDGHYHFLLSRDAILLLEIETGMELDEIYSAIGRAQFYGDDTAMSCIDPVEVVRRAFLFGHRTSDHSRAVEVCGDRERFIARHIANDPARARLVALAVMGCWIGVRPALQIPDGLISAANTTNRGWRN